MQQVLCRAEVTLSSQRLKAREQKKSVSRILPTAKTATMCEKVSVVQYGDQIGGSNSLVLNAQTRDLQIPFVQPRPQESCQQPTTPPSPEGLPVPPLYHASWSRPSRYLPPVCFRLLVPSVAPYSYSALPLLLTLSALAPFSAPVFPFSLLPPPPPPFPPLSEHDVRYLMALGPQ